MWLKLPPMFRSDSLLMISVAMLLTAVVDLFLIAADVAIGQL